MGRSRFKEEINRQRAAQLVMRLRSTGSNTEWSSSRTVQASWVRHYESFQEEGWGRGKSSVWFSLSSSLRKTILSLMYTYCNQVIPPPSLPLHIDAQRLHQTIWRPLGGQNIGPDQCPSLQLYSMMVLSFLKKAESCTTSSITFTSSLYGLKLNTQLVSNL